MLTFIRRRSQIILPVIAGVSAALLIIVISSKYGLALSPDSVCYISMANNSLQGNGYAIYDLEPAVDWPPLYPTALAAGKLIGIKIKTWAYILNALLFGYFVFSSALWLQQKIKWRPLFWIGCCGLLLSPAIVYISKFAWSELPFSILVFLCLTRLSKIRNEPTLTGIFTVAVLASLACLTRYVGVTLAIYCLFLILSLKINFKTRVFHSAIFLFTAFTPLVLWIIRNFAVSSTLTGHRTASSLSFLGNIYSAADTLSSWLLPHQWTATIRMPLAGLIIFLIFYFLWKSLKRNGQQHETKFPIYAMLGYCIFYIVFMTIISSTVASGNVETRFLSPIYVPLLISMILAIDFVIHNSLSRRKMIKVLILSFSLFWAVQLSSSTYKEITSSLKRGAGGYASTVWQNSEMIAYIRSNPPPHKLYSNYPDGIYGVAGLSSSMSPQKSYYASISAPPLQFEKFQAEIDKSGSVALAWFGDSNRGILFTLEELKISFELTPMEDFTDGQLYRVNSKSTGLK